MSLIEQLGGYDLTNDFYKRAVAHGFPLVEIRESLLEYRRQHNIYEVGDRVVLPYKNYRSDVFELTKLFKEIYDEKGIVYRHATDLEIQAGKRLEVKA